MGKGDDPNCRMAAVPFGPEADATPADPRVQTRAFALQERRRKINRTLSVPLGPEWGVWDTHVEDRNRIEHEQVLDQMHEQLSGLFAGQVKIVEAQHLTAAQRHAAGSTGDGIARYLAVKLIDPATAEFSGALQALVQFESGDGPVARELRRTRQFSQVDAVRDSIRRRCLRQVPGFRAEPDLPDDWLDRLIHHLKHEQVSKIDDVYGHGPARRSLGVHQWSSRHVDADVLAEAGRQLGFVAADRVR